MKPSPHNRSEQRNKNQYSLFNFSRPRSTKPGILITIDEGKISSQGSSVESDVPLFSIDRLRKNISIKKAGRQKAYCIRGLILGGIVAIIGFIAALIWIALVLTLIHRLRPAPSSCGLHKISEKWRDPDDSTGLLTPWPEDFSRDILPKNCHSHNDYWRRVPLYDALAAGCTGVEADIWLPEEDSNSTELRVGHSHSSLTSSRTLSSLYINPFTTILDSRNGSGLFDVNPNKTVTLLLDFKSNATLLWPLVQQNLAPLRRDGWLRHWNATLNTTVPGPITIVATGKAPFNLITMNTTYRDIFFDAPLDDLSSGVYEISNSYYASVSLSRTMGTPWFGRFSGKQTQMLSTQVNAAEMNGLMSRYWDTPGWPVSVRDRVWNALVSGGVGMLNVDDLSSATAWNWDWCVVAGLTLC